MVIVAQLVVSVRDTKNIRAVNRPPALEIVPPPYLKENDPVCSLNNPGGSSTHMIPSTFLAAAYLLFPEGHLVNAHLSFHGLLTSF